MPFKKRHGGHKKPGVPNKLTREVRVLLQRFVDDNFDEAATLWKKIKSPERKFMAYLAIIRYIVPVPSNDFSEDERKELLELLRTSKLNKAA